MRQERIFFAVLFTIIAILAVIIMQPFLTYLVLAAILTYTLFPVYDFIAQRTRKPALSSGLSILIALILMVLPVVLLGTELVRQISGAYSGLQGARLQEAIDYVSGLTGNRLNLRETLGTAFGQIRSSMLALAPNILGSIGDMFLGLFIMFFVMYYAFLEGEGFMLRIKRLMPLDPTLKESLFSELRSVTQAVLYGQVMTAIIQGSLGALGLLIFGVPNWLFWGAIMIITAFIPLLGTPLVWVPAAIGQLLVGETARGVGLLIFGATVVMNIDNFIRPRLVSGRTSIHPVLILVGVLGGLKLFGFIGLLVGPLVLALLMAFVKFYDQAYTSRRNRNLETRAR